MLALSCFSNTLLNNYYEDIITSKVSRKFVTRLHCSCLIVGLHYCVFISGECTKYNVLICMLHYICSYYSSVIIISICLVM